MLKSLDERYAEGFVDIETVVRDILYPNIALYLQKLAGGARLLRQDRCIRQTESFEESYIPHPKRQGSNRRLLLVLNSCEESRSMFRRRSGRFFNDSCPKWPFSKLPILAQVFRNFDENMKIFERVFRNFVHIEISKDQTVDRNSESPGLGMAVSRPTRKQI